MRVSPLCVLFILAGCGGGAPQVGKQEMPPPPAGVAMPIVRDVPMTRELTGRIEAVDYVELRPQVGGLVQKVLVADGAEVTVGQVILEIDQRPLANALAQAEAEVTRSQAVLAQAVREVGRNQKLVEDKVVSQQAFDDAESARLAAEAAVAAAKAMRDSAQLDLDHAKVTSPIAGRLGKVLITAGNLVQGGGPVPATLLATIVSVDPVDVVFDLDEATWRTLGESLRASQEGGKEVPVNVGIAGEDGYPHPGVVRFVDNHVDSASGTIRIRARVANPQRLLTPGAFARVQLQIAPPKPTVLINERAVLTQLATRFVLVVDEQGVTQVRPVRLGETVGNLRVATEGLQPGERIAVSGLPIAGFGKMFFPGMPVSPVATSMETLQPEGVPAAAGAEHGKAETSK